MPLAPSTLQSDLAAFFAAPPVVMAGDDVDYTSSRSACASEWADAMTSYAAAVVPASTTVAAASAVLLSSLASAFATPSAAAAVDTAFQTWAASVGAGMAPAFVAVPPPSPPGFAAGLGTTQASHGAAAAYWSGLIDTWCRTGTATPSGGGSAVPWS
jgi:hypothetical protein